MITSLEAQAEGVSNRLKAVGIVGFDPIVIIGFLQTLLACWQQNHESDPSQARVAFARKYQRHPKRIHRRVAEHVLFESHKDGEPMTKDEADEIAQAVIDQALSTDEQTATACCMECTPEDDT